MSRCELQNPACLDAAGAAAAIRRGEMSSEALVAACLKTIAQKEEAIGAWAHLDPELALAQARAADARLQAGKSVGSLHGVPIAVKDIFDTADLPTENGSPVFTRRCPEQDAACVALLRAGGAVILGKTVTTELALLTPAKTRNPHNLEHTPGGSSSGSAAAVAAGMVPAALGSQTAGSLIRPASYCGVFAFKPTLGLIPRAGVLMQSHTLDTVGVYGRSVDDLALLADCMIGFEPGDAVSFRYRGARLFDAVRAKLSAPPRFAFVRTPAWSQTTPSLRAAYDELATALGARVTEIDIPVLADVIEAQRIIQLVENARYYGPLMRADPELLSDGLKERLRTGLAVAADDYDRALKVGAPAYAQVVHAIDGFDAILTPATAGPAPAGLTSTGTPIFNGLWTYLGMPAVSLPLLEAEGLPLGVQLVGRRREDAVLLAVARAFTDELGPRPPLIN